MNKNESKNLWKYFRNYTDLDASSSLVMAVSIPCFVVMALYLKQCWDVQSHKTNSLTSTAIALPSKFLTDLHPDCSDSGMYQPVLIEEHDVITAAHD
jgi:hypothetical protein